MKRLHRILIAIILAATATAAQADAIATAPNRAGGVITLTDVDCKDENTKIAYSTGRHGENTILGCWWIAKPDVMIQWGSGNISTFPAVMFEMVDGYQRKPAGRGM